MKPAPHSSLAGIIRRLFSVLSSAEFLIWIIGGWILLYVSSMIWTEESFAYFIAALRDNMIVQIPFLFFLISGYLNLLRVSVSVSKKNRTLFLASVLLPSGILIFFTGFFVSAATRHFEWVLARTGDVIKPGWSAGAYKVDAIMPGISERFLDIDIESGKGLFKYEPKVRVRDQRAGTFDIGAFPPARIDGSYFHILNFGLAPNISVSEDAVVKGQEYMPLRILGPGSVDTFEIQPLPYKFMLSLEPERTIQKGMVTASEYNLRYPLYRIRVLEGEKVIAEAVTKESLRFRNLEIGFQEPGFWVQLEIVKDSGVPLIIAGLFMATAGIPLFFFGIGLNFLRRGVSR